MSSKGRGGAGRGGGANAGAGAGAGAGARPGAEARVGGGAGRGGGAGGGAGILSFFKECCFRARVSVNPNPNQWRTPDYFETISP